MLTYRYVDDGWYCQSWWIEEENGKRFAEAFSEADAQENCRTLNAIRQLSQRIKTMAETEPVTNELPFQTFERIFSAPWPGGDSEWVRGLLFAAGIQHKPGTDEANLALQQWLLDTVPGLHVKA